MSCALKNVMLGCSYRALLATHAAAHPSLCPVWDLATGSILRELQEETYFCHVGLIPLSELPSLMLSALGSGTLESPRLFSLQH